MNEWREKSLVELIGLLRTGGFDWIIRAECVAVGGALGIYIFTMEEPARRTRRGSGSLSVSYRSSESAQASLACPWYDLLRGAHISLGLATFLLARIGIFWAVASNVRCFIRCVCHRF